VDEFSSIIRSDPQLASRLVEVLERLERGETLHDALKGAGVPPAAAKTVLAAARRELKRSSKSVRSGAERAGADVVIAYSDGGSRGNPGEAAAAVVLCDAGGEELLREAKRIGRATNNVAEYEAAILALELSAQLGARRVVLRVDSELVSRQVEGRYKVKHPDLKPYHARVRELAASFASFTIEHIPRSQNLEADKLVNAILDEKTG
jgi:ribonuclease HI